MFFILLMLVAILSGMLVFWHLQDQREKQDMQDQRKKQDMHTRLFTSAERSRLYNNGRGKK